MGKTTAAVAAFELGAAISASHVPPPLFILISPHPQLSRVQILVVYLMV